VQAVSEEDDGALMQAYARGDMRAFERLYARHRASLYSYLVRQTRDRELASDLFQEVWSKVVSSRARYSASAKFQTFLFTIAYNCFIDHCRRQALRRTDVLTSGAQELLPGSDLEQPERRLENSQLGAQLRRAIAALPAEQRDVFLLYEQARLSIEQIAAVTGVGAETAKSRLRYAVAKLRSALEAPETRST
jgi:RNA polymerase sigma-70 factor (ECF subfamily)